MTLAVQSTIVVRSANYPDADAVIACDPLGRSDLARVNFIHRAVASRACFVGELNGSVVGYGVLEYTFFECGFIRLLAVRDEDRRRGVGSALVRHMEGACKTPKVFTTTGRSNAPMQGLLKKLGYRRSGTIQNLDVHDAELVFFKKLR